MTKSERGRMLLSHNFDISEDIFPKLNISEFTQVFTDELSKYPQIQVRQLNHAHWLVEILFPSDEFSPPQVGEFCAEALVNKRMSQTQNNDSLPDILILGGLKKTPPLSDDPDALQTGEWGIDVVETQSAENFLIGIEWETKTANKTIENVFKIEKIST